tara:strand:+ start:96 stop:1277 length:1182 start_codon:yes stop_codon:yes gene_type:complete
MIQKYPYPYKAWFTIANDPDNTLIKDWRELNSFIWKDLKLPLANSLFLKSYNHNLPNQVNLNDYPEILSQKHDIIHTWGDYMHSRKNGFDRQDAVEACDMLLKHSINPRVWIDHSKFIGNLLHSSNKGSIPHTFDGSGIKYTNYVYSLDLIKKAGIRYIWDGKITNIVGQDRKISSYEYFKLECSSRFNTIIKTILNKIVKSKKLRKKLRINKPENKQYYTYLFPDGNKLYCFTRYGNWKDSDIYGLGNIISPKKIDELISNQSTMVVYTHLGKRPKSKKEKHFHIPEATKKSLKNVSEKFKSKQLMVSPLSIMLDYLVLRDNIKLFPKKNLIEFCSDGIRYNQIQQSDLNGKKFSFNNNFFDLENIQVISNGKSLKFNIKIENENKIFSIIF